ncbi:putative membrane transporter protein YfcA [Burkholderiales bacterium]|nr:MAG: TSUP family transporter [Burkholderiales bacterium]CAG1000560.1 putative membrane transporter protein YfcA [Burkholderiales bacterium]
MEIGVLIGLAFFAGWVDAVVGGGGLLQVPGLFAVYPGTTPATLFGTNKLASIAGTSVATVRYLRAVSVPLRVLGPAFLAALLGSFLGARAVALLPVAWVRPVILVLLVGVAVYTFWHRDLGKHHAPRLGASAETWWALGVGLALGFYDGFFGPGTGMFLIFIFVRVFGYDFLSASAAAKVVNFGTNLAALAYFIPTGHVLWLVGLGMAVANIAGSLLGTQLALRHGSGFVRRVFLGLVIVLIGKFGYDTFLA